MSIHHESIASIIEKQLLQFLYNPLNDILFKFTFGKEERKTITIDFLNAALKRYGKNRITDIQFRNIELSPLNEEDKLTRLDIFCTLASGEQIDVEVQIVNHRNMQRRTLYYWAQMYLMSLGSGKNYRELTPSITINILNYKLFPHSNPHSMYSIYDIQNNLRLNEDMEIHFIEIPKFTKKPIADMTHLERWIAYFSNKLNPQEKEELIMSEVAIKDAVHAANVFFQSKEERLAYINREMAIMDYVSDREDALEEGLRKGREEAALDMLRDREDPNKIMKYTKVTPERLAVLRTML